MIRERDRLAEIEITPEMFAAGKQAFEHWVGSTSDEMVVSEIPTDHSLAVLISGVFRSMMAEYPYSVMND